MGNLNRRGFIGIAAGAIAGFLGGLKWLRRTKPDAQASVIQHVSYGGPSRFVPIETVRDFRDGSVKTTFVEALAADGNLRSKVVITSRETFTFPVSAEMLDDGNWAWREVPSSEIVDVSNADWIVRG